MKRIGTVSSAMGFIFLGIWMILDRLHPSIADTVFKYWPALFVILGAEIILVNSSKGEGKVTFNPLIILVILIYLFVNTFHIFTTRFFNENININPFEFSPNNTKYKSIDFKETINLKAKRIVLNSKNINLQVSRTDKGEILMQGKVYFDENSFYYTFKPKYNDLNGNLNIMLDDKDIRKVDMNIEIPENIDLDIKSDNLVLGSDLKINDCLLSFDNGKINIKNVNKLDINSNNADVNAEDIREFILKGDNGNIDLNGKTEIIKIKLDNGKINVKNNNPKDINIKLGSGIVNFTTNEKNIDVDLSINSGVCKFNNESRVNSGIKRRLGSGENKVYIELNNGVVNFKSVE